jgi:transcriptional regulator with XRE-family HTH domain
MSTETETESVLKEQAQPFYSELGRSIAVARGSVSGRALADSVHISRRTLTKIEKGDPSVAFGSYCAVAQAMGRSWLFDLIETKPASGSLVPRHYLTGVSALSLARGGGMPALWYSSSLSSPSRWQIAGAGIDGAGHLLGASELWDATEQLSSLGVAVKQVWSATHERALFDLMHHFCVVRQKPVPNIQVRDIDDVVDIGKIEQWVAQFRPFLSAAGADMMHRWIHG